MERYEKVDMEVIMFEYADVITNSPGVDTPDVDGTNNG